MTGAFNLRFEPSGLQATGNSESTLLDLARSTGLTIQSSCGGRGGCRSCAVRIEGPLPPPSEGEIATFTPLELAVGWRRACQTHPIAACTVHLPPISTKLPFTIGKESAQGIVTIAEPLWLPTDQDGYWHRCSLVADPFTGGAPLALAVDLGTTNIAAALIDIASARVVGSDTQTNPQVAFGGDLISRLAHARLDKSHAAQLQQAAIDAITGLASKLTLGQHERIVEVSVVGNSVMHHLLLGLPIASLTQAPYCPAMLQAIEQPASELGFRFAPQAMLYCAPNVAGFVGGDHVAALLDVTDNNPHRRWAMLDIGTNTEIALCVDGDITSVSCASGPAFEGGKLLCGMRAAPGAIDRVLINDTIELSTIAQQPPRGLCGSGVLSLLAALRQADLIDARGRLQLGHPAIRERGSTREILLYDNPLQRQLPIVFTQDDIRAVQLAKGAVRTGLDLLLAQANLTAQDLDLLLIAGAFGSFVNIDDAFRIGLLPQLPRERVLQLGNSAGAGAQRLALCAQARRQADQLATSIHFLELASAPDFQRTYSTRCRL